MEHKNVAVILAGGIGERMKLSMPKQLMKVAGKALIDHTLSVFQSSEDIDEILILMTPSHVDSLKVITSKYGKVTSILEGGETRNKTSQIAINHLKDKYKDCNILFHDAVRPFLSHDIIANCVDALNKYNAVDVAIESSDTIIEVDNDNIIKSIPDRSTLRRGQTPQAFRLSVIDEAYQLASRDKDFKATDDCGVVLEYLPDEPIFVVNGSDSNMKVTQPVDAFIADKLFQISSSKSRSSTDADRRRHFSGKTIVVFGGSKGIGKEVIDTAGRYTDNVYGFSRSTNNIDVTSERDIKYALKKAYDETGRIDYVVNTAGELMIAPLEKLSREDIDYLININYLSPVLLAKHSLPYLKETEGQLVLFTSSSYTRGRSDYSLYSSSKAATVNLVQALAEEWIDDNVRINCINPERTATPMRTKAFGEEDPGTLLSAKEVADATVDTMLGTLTGQVVDVRRES